MLNDIESIDCGKFQWMNVVFKECIYIWDVKVIDSQKKNIMSIIDSFILLCKKSILHFETSLEKDFSCIDIS